MIELFTLVEETKDEDEATLAKFDEANGIFKAKGGLVERRTYSEEEYSAIRATADEFVIAGYRRFNWYDYQQGGRPCFETEERAPKPIPDENILVKDGAFYGAIFKYVDRLDGRRRKEYYTIAKAGIAEFIYVVQDWSYSAWGNTFSFESVRIEKIAD